MAFWNSTKHLAFAAALATAVGTAGAVVSTHGAYTTTGAKMQTIAAADGGKWTAQKNAEFSQVVPEQASQNRPTRLLAADGGHWHSLNNAQYS